MKISKKNIYGARPEALQLYLNDVSKIPLLTVEEEREIGFLAKSGDEEAIKKLVESNLRFVVKVAKKYRGFGVAFLDLINEGNLGLMQAAKRFDPDKEVRFISYAIWWIRQSILTFLSDMSHAVRLPTKVNSLLYKISSFRKSAITEEDLHRSVAGIAEKVGLSEKGLAEMMSIAQQPLSMDHPIGEGNFDLENILSKTDFVSAEDGLVHDALKQILREAVLQLRENEQQVLNLRFGMDQEKCLTLREIGVRMGVSRERVRQIQEKALAKLRLSPHARSICTANLAGAA